MVCMGLEPKLAGWKVQTNPLICSGPLHLLLLYLNPFSPIYHCSAGTTEAGAIVLLSDIIVFVVVVVATGTSLPPMGQICIQLCNCISSSSI